MTDLCTSGGSIEELRKVIDATDTELFGLLEKRRLANSKRPEPSISPSASEKFSNEPWHALKLKVRF